MKVALAKQAHKYLNPPVTPAKNTTAPHNRNIAFPRQRERSYFMRDEDTYNRSKHNLLPKKVVRSDCENIAYLCEN